MSSGGGKGDLLQTCFIRLANAFGQACKRVPCIAFVHVNVFAKAFALTCERVSLRMRTRLAWRANAFETRVHYTLHLGSTVLHTYT